MLREAWSGRQPRRPASLRRAGGAAVRSARGLSIIAGATRDVGLGATNWIKQSNFSIAESLPGTIHGRLYDQGIIPNIAPDRGALQG